MKNDGMFIQLVQQIFQAQSANAIAAIPPDHAGRLHQTFGHSPDLSCWSCWVSGGGVGRIWSNDIFQDLCM